jgi:hypothetical protein
MPWQAVDGRGFFFGPGFLGAGESVSGGSGGRVSGVFSGDDSACWGTDFGVGTGASDGSEVRGHGDGTWDGEGAGAPAVCSGRGVAVPAVVTCGATASVLGVRLGARVVPATSSKDFSGESNVEEAVGTGSATMGFGPPEWVPRAQDEPAAVTISSRTPAPSRALSPAQA